MQAGPPEGEDREKSPPPREIPPLIARTHARTHERNETISRLAAAQGLRPSNLRHYITLHSLHYITLHYITLHYITLHYTTLHYIT